MNATESWFQNHWRPCMAWLYAVINAFDFIIFPILNWLFSYYSNTPLIAWTPLTLQGGGLLHVAFGAIVTATSWGRTKEKIMNR